MALSNRRIVDLADDRVTFTYKPSGSAQLKPRILPALAFIALFLKHVLPKGFMKVRSYGLLAPAYRLTLRAIILAILTSRSQPPQPAPTPTRSITCPECGGVMERIGFLKSPRAPP